MFQKKTAIASDNWHPSRLYRGCKTNWKRGNMLYFIAGTIIVIAALVALNIAQAITNSRLLDEIWRPKNEKHK